MTSQPSPAVGDALSPPTRRTVSVFNSVISRFFLQGIPLLFPATSPRCYINVISLSITTPLIIWSIPIKPIG